MAPKNNTNKELSIYSHLDELRRVLLVSVVAVVVLAIGAYYFTDWIMAVLLDPVTQEGYDIVFIGITEALITKIKLSLAVGFVAALPIILWQSWTFIAPALTRNERKYIRWLVVIGFAAFIGGVAFGFLIVYRMGVKFLLQFAGPELVPMLTIGNYISFTIAFLLPFGLVFELPLVAFFLSKIGLITYPLLKKSRKFAVLGILVLSAAITPTPDVFTLMVMAGPMYLLFEVSIWITRLVERGKERRERDEALADTAGADM